MTAESFRTYVEQCLVPVLSVGTVVVMDNVRHHHTTGVLYLVLDVYSRKIVAAQVHAEESMELSPDLITWALQKEDVDPRKLVIHADNGGPMKGSTMLATLQRLGIVALFSRPSVSDDNPYVEEIFRTLKYPPGYPRKPFASLAAATAWWTPSCAGTIPSISTARSAS